ncbi:MAG: hypothetical protein ABIS17_15515 [Casimicrobiaceae bacterium]
MSGKLFLMALTVLASDIAMAQTGTDLSSGMLVPENATMSGPGPITASPMDRNGAPHGTRATPAKPLSRLLGTGVVVDYGRGGPSALGDTGGLTTGPRGANALPAVAGTQRAASLSTTDVPAFVPATPDLSKPRDVTGTTPLSPQ